MERMLATQSALDTGSASQHAPGLLEGIVISGSWNPVEATIEAVIGDTYAFIADSGDRFVTIIATMATGQIGDQYGPIGGERVLLYQTQSGWVAKLEHGYDDSPQAPMGERWIAHRKVQDPDGPPVWDSRLRLTNDGSDGDGLGGLAWDGGSRHSVETAGGLQRVAEDSTQQVRDVAGETSTTLDAAAQTVTHDAGGGTKTIVDGNGRAIAQVAQKIGHGDLFDNLTAGNAALHHDHAVALSSSIIGDTLQSLATQMATAMQAAGIPNAAAFLAIVKAAGWVTGHVTAPTIPDGSSVVRIAS
jgi:hypothetical protein